LQRFQCKYEAEIKYFLQAELALAFPGAALPAVALDERLPRILHIVTGFAS
jgi:hypothetical protein